MGLLGLLLGGSSTRTKAVIQQKIEEEQKRLEQAKEILASEKQEKKKFARVGSSMNFDNSIRHWTFEVEECKKRIQRLKEEKKNAPK